MVAVMAAVVAAVALVAKWLAGEKWCDAATAQLLFMVGAC